MKKWPLRFSVECDGPVWNILSSNDSDELLFEVRLDSEVIEYNRLDLNTFTLQPFRLPDIPWMSNVVYFTPEVVVIQEFDEDQNPDNVRLQARNWSGLELWNASDTRFLAATAEGIELSSIGLVSPLTGKPENGKALSDGPRLELPWHYLEGEEYFEQVANFIQTSTDESPVRAIDYFEVGEKAVIAYYVKHEKFLGLRLLSIDSEGNVGIYENLGDDLQGIADPTFLISKRNIIFVKEKQHFFVYGIPD